MLDDICPLQQHILITTFVHVSCTSSLSPLYITSLFTNHMVAITTTKNEYYKGLQTHTESNYINIANNNYLVFTREKFITAFFNQLAWQRKIKHTLCKPDYFKLLLCRGLNYKNINMIILGYDSNLRYVVRVNSKKQSQDILTLS